MANARGGMMNTRGPNGGKGASNTTTTKAPSSPTRNTSYSAKGHKELGDTSQVRSRNLQGQKAQSSSASKIRQSPYNKGPMTDYNVSGQTMGRTKVGKQPAVNSGWTKEYQNTMTGKGKPQG